MTHFFLPRETLARLGGPFFRLEKRNNQTLLFYSPVQGFLQFERKREMKMVLTSEVENVDNWLANRQERHATISQFAENIVEYTNEDGSGVVALTFNITDEKKMNDIMQDNKTRAEMIRHGVKPETITSFIEK
jgi:hypothetical protein